MADSPVDTALVLLRRLRQWDALNPPIDAPYGDATYWVAEIDKVLASVPARSPDVLTEIEMYRSDDEDIALLLVSLHELREALRDLGHRKIPDQGRLSAWSAFAEKLQADARAALARSTGDGGEQG